MTTTTWENKVKFAIDQLSLVAGPRIKKFFFLKYFRFIANKNTAYD